jgi:DNA-binding NtrC family response regulator
VIAGASRVLLAAVAANAFSETLYYRLNLIHVDRTGLQNS